MSGARIVCAAAVYLYSVLLDTVRLLGTPLLRKIGESKNWDIDKRQKLPSPVRDHRGKTVVWLHAASLGEAKLLLKFISMLQQRHPDELYIVTATTRTGVAFLEKHRHPSFCAIGFQPIDTLTLVYNVLDHYSVKRVWLLETELWPSLLFACGKRSVPVGIVNGRIEQASFRWYMRLLWLLRPLLAPVAPVFAQSDEYAERFCMLGIDDEQVHTVGNIKGHVVVARPDRHDWLLQRRAMNVDEQAFVVTAGCAHRGEGGVLRAFFDRMSELSYPCKLIVVPRHLDEASEIVAELGGRTVHLDAAETSRTWDICVVEKIGVMDALYSIADASIVCGTFVEIGGHNVWDAACFGVPVFFGPFYEKQKESCTTLLEAGVGFTAEAGDALAEQMYGVVKGDPMRFFAAQKAFIELTNKTRSVVEPLLP